MVEITERLAEPEDDGAAAVAALGIEAIEFVTDAARAGAIIQALPEQVGLDIETEAESARPWLTITQKGLRAKRQPKLKDKAGLDPRRARPAPGPNL